MGPFRRSIADSVRLFSLVLLGAVAIVQAQTPQQTGEIQLTVKDPSGVGMHAEGSLSNPVANVIRHYR